MSSAGSNTSRRTSSAGGNNDSGRDGRVSVLGSPSRRLSGAGRRGRDGRASAAESPTTSTSSSEGKMSVRTMAIIVGFLGALSYFFASIAVNTKIETEAPIHSASCKYSATTTIQMGCVSFGFLVLTTIAGYRSLFYPYKGKSVPRSALFQSTLISVCYHIALLTGLVATGLLLWPTFDLHNNLNYDVHRNVRNACPTANTRLLSGGALVSLDSTLFWLLSLMLVNNAREDYFDEVQSDDEGEQGAN